MKPIRPTRSTSAPSAARSQKSSDGVRSLIRQQRELETEMKKLEAHIVSMPLREQERRAARMDTIPVHDDLHGRNHPFRSGATRGNRQRQKKETAKNFVAFLLVTLLAVGLGSLIMKTLGL